MSRGKWKMKRWNKAKHSVETLFDHAPGSLVTARGIDHSARAMKGSNNVPLLNLRSIGREIRQCEKLNRILLSIKKGRGKITKCFAAVGSMMTMSKIGHVDIKMQDRRRSRLIRARQSFNCNENLQSIG